MTVVFALMLGAVATGLLIRLLPAPDEPSWPRLGLLVGWYGLSVGAIFAASAEHAWLLGTWSERVSPVLMFGGLGLLAVGLEQLGAARTLGLRTDKLVDAGIYAYSRHPQYVAIGFAAFGLGLLGRSGLAIMLAAALTIAMLGWIPTEERRLSRRLDDSYDDYRRRTRALLGRRRTTARNREL